MVNAMNKAITMCFSLTVYQLKKRLSLLVLVLTCVPVVLFLSTLLVLVLTCVPVVLFLSTRGSILLLAYCNVPSSSFCGLK